eukprot:3212006-Amphidinium_carterae.1
MERNPCRAEQLLDKMQKDFSLWLLVSSCELILLACQCKLVEDLKSSPPDAFCFNSVIQACAREGHSESAQR